MAKSATATKVRRDSSNACPNTDTRTEEWLSSKNVRFTFIESVPIEKIDLEASLRNQARVTQALVELTVETYADAMKRDEEFPAVVGYRKGNKYILIDGNHRVNAALQARKSTVAMYEIAKDTNPATITMLTFEANTKHGLPNSMDDKLKHAVYLVDNGATQKAAAAALNIPLNAVQRAWSRAQAEQRAMMLGIKRAEWDALVPAVKQRLTNIKTDEGFIAFAKLVLEAGLTAEEVNEYVAEINKTASGRQQENYVAMLREQMRDRIQATAGGLIRGRRGPKNHLMLVTSSIKRFRIDDAYAKELVESVQGDDRVRVRDSVRQAIDTLEQLYENLSAGE